MAIDNRISLGPSEVSFGDGTGLAHDSYPAPGEARYDTLRSYLIGLLSLQSGFDEPVERRLGSLWFNLNDSSIKIRFDDGAIVSAAGTEWVDVSNAILLDTDLTLQDWFEQVKDLLIESDSGESATFARLTQVVVDEPISAGSVVYVSGNQLVKKTSSASDPVGVTTTTSDTGGTVSLKHSGTARVRAVPGLAISAGDRLYLSTDGRISTSGTVSIGTAFDVSIYDSSASDPVVLIILKL